jgi:hypothetical protein
LESISHRLVGAIVDGGDGTVITAGKGARVASGMGASKAVVLAAAKAVLGLKPFEALAAAVLS